MMNQIPLNTLSQIFNHCVNNPQVVPMDAADGDAINKLALLARGRDQELLGLLRHGVTLGSSGALHHFILMLPSGWYLRISCFDTAQTPVTLTHYTKFETVMGAMDQHLLFTLLRTVLPGGLPGYQPAIIPQLMAQIKGQFYNGNPLFINFFSELETLLMKKSSMMWGPVGSYPYFPSVSMRQPPLPWIRPFPLRQPNGGFAFVSDPVKPRISAETLAAIANAEAEIQLVNHDIFDRLFDLAQSIEPYTFYQWIEGQKLRHIWNNDKWLAAAIAEKINYINGSPYFQREVSFDTEYTDTVEQYHTLLNFIGNKIGHKFHVDMDKVRSLTAASVVRQLHLFKLKLIP